MAASKEQQIEALKRIVANTSNPQGIRDNAAKKLAEWEEESAPAPAKKEEGEKKDDGEKPKKKGRGRPAGSGNKKKKAKAAKPAKEPAPPKEKKKKEEVATPSCEELEQAWDKRRADAKKRNANKKKVSKFSLVADKVEGATLAAIKTIPKADIKEDPKKFISKFQKIQKSMAHFFADMRDVLGDVYESKEAKEALEGIEKYIEGLQKQYVKKMKEGGELAEGYENFRFEDIITNIPLGAKVKIVKNLADHVGYNGEELEVVAADDDNYYTVENKKGKSWYCGEEELKVLKKMEMGGGVGGDDNEAEVLWNSWDELKRTHFLVDHIQYWSLDEKEKGKVLEEAPSDKFNELPEYIKEEIILHCQNGYKHGGSIPNNYKGKTAEEVWNEWDEKQRFHFCQDHTGWLTENGKLTNANNEAFHKYSLKEYVNLPEVAQDAVKRHVSEGQYARGGGIKPSKDGDRHAYYVVAYKTEQDWLDKKPTIGKEKRVNWDEANQAQERYLEEGFFASAIHAEKNDREVSIMLNPEMI